MPLQRGIPIRIDGKDYVLARNETGAIVWSTDTRSPDATELDRYTEELPLGAYFGMGSSLPAIRGQCDYALDCELTEWDQLGPGPLHSQVGLALDVTVAVIDTARDSSNNRYLYIGGGTVLKKVAFSNLSTVYETKTFTGTITDLLVVKDGATPQGSAAATLLGDGVILVGFAQSGQLEQVNSIGVAGADTYQALEASPNRAYRGHLALVNSGAGTSYSVYGSAPGVSLGTSLSDVSAGPYSTVIAYLPGDANTDYTDDRSWSDTYRALAGDPGSSVTDLHPYQQYAAACKPEGVIRVEGASTSNSVPLLDYRAYRHDDNGRNSVVWNDRLIVPTRYDILQYPPGDYVAVGIKRLISNLSPVQGYPTATAAYGDRLFVSYYDGTDSYIVEMRPRNGISTPQDLLIYPMTKLSSYKCMKMAVFTNAAGVTYLLYGRASATNGKHDVGYCVLDPASSRTYATGGLFYSTRFGSPTYKTVIERLTFYAVGCDANNYWSVAIAWDDGSFNTIGTITGNGRQVVNFTPGTNDSGYRYQLRLTCTRATSSDRPRLRGAAINPLQTAGGGIIVEGFRQRPVEDMFDFTIIAGAEMDDGDGGYIVQNEQEQYDNLTAILNAGVGVDLVAPHHFGNSTAKKIVIKAVRYVSDQDDGELYPMRKIQVLARQMLNG